MWRFGLCLFSCERHPQCMQDTLLGVGAYPFDCDLPHQTSFSGHRFSFSSFRIHILHLSNLELLYTQGASFRLSHTK